MKNKLFLYLFIVILIFSIIFILTNKPHKKDLAPSYSQTVTVSSLI